MKTQELEEQAEEIEVEEVDSPSQEAEQSEETNQPEPATETELTDEETGELDEGGADEGEGDIEASAEIEGITPARTEDDKESVKDPTLPRKLRGEIKKRDQKIREYEDRLKALEAPKTETRDPGPRPKLADAEFGYDEDRYSAALDKWLADKQSFDAEQNAAKQAQAEENARWQSKVDAYDAGRKSVPFRNFDEAEQNVKASLGDDRKFNLIMGYSKNPHGLVYALNGSEETLKKLASEKDFAEFAFEAGRLDAKLKVTEAKRKPNARPESKVQGSSPMEAGVDATLERLEREADRTGDRTKVRAYRRKLSDQRNE